jgi:hypothetical protein
MNWPQDSSAMGIFSSCLTENKSQSYVTTDGQSASLSWCQATIRARDQFYFLLEIFFRHLRVCYFVAPSLTRGRVCNLMLLLGITSAVPLWYESRGTQDCILLSQFLRLFQPGGPGPRIYIPQEQGGPVIPPPTVFPFHRLLRLAGLQWRYSYPPPHGPSHRKHYVLRYGYAHFVPYRKHITSPAGYIQFVHYRKHITSPLQGPIDECCLGKQSLFTVRTTRNTQIQSVPHSKHITSPLQGPID